MFTKDSAVWPSFGAGGENESNGRTSLLNEARPSSLTFNLIGSIISSGLPGIINEDIHYIMGFFGRIKSFWRICHDCKQAVFTAATIAKD